MEKLFKRLTVSLILLFSFSFTSCESDEHDEPSKTDTQSTEARKFVGIWYSDATSGGEWTFNSDGTCEFYYHDKYVGEWSYNHESKVLATTILNWNWEIYTISDNAWTGRHLAGKGSTFTYKRIE